MPAASEHDLSHRYSKLACSETPIERSLYEALHELQRLQGASVGGKVAAPVAVDFVHADQAVAQSKHLWEITA